jgi:hypothetical protein
MEWSKGICYSAFLYKVYRYSLQINPLVLDSTKEPINIILSNMKTTNSDSADIDRGVDVISNSRH